MIEAYCGLIGGGKSYNAVLRVLEYLSRGGMVVTNLNLVVEPWYNEFPLYQGGDYGDGFNAPGVRWVLRELYRWDLQDGQLLLVPDCELGAMGLAKRLPAGRADLPVLMVWDEGADFWDSEDRAKADREFLSLMRHSRKLGMDFVFIVQEFTEINKRIRNQTAFVWRFIDMSSFRVPGLGVGTGWIPGLKRQIRTLQFARSQWEHNRAACEPVKVGWVTKDQRIFGCYRTDALHSAIEVRRDCETDFRGRGSVDSQKGACPLMSVFSGAGAGAVCGVLSAAIM